MSEAFVDTNVALYLASSDPAKAAKAETIIEAGGIISIQVLTDFADVTHRKFKGPWPAIRQQLAALRGNLKVVPVTSDTHDLALVIAERYRFRVYDAQLIAAALLAGCTTFWSEDLHDGQVIEDTLTIRNPFA